MAESRVTHARTSVGDEAWRVAGYDDVRALLQERLLSRAHHEPERASRMSRSALFGGPMGADPETEIANAARRRKLLGPAFSARRIEVLRPRVQELVDGLVDELLTAGPPADLHARLAFPLPVQVICELLGVPYADRDAFGRYADEAADTVDEQRSRQGLTQLWTYMGGLVERKRAEPADDVVSDLVREAEAAGRPLDEVAMLGAGLLFAGFETTVAAIDRAVLLLLTHRSQWERVCADPAAVPAAVEESLRYRLPVAGSTGGLFRYAAADLDVADARVHRGDLLVLDIAEANRDATRFAEPDRFDVERSPNPHLAFGFGPRFCLGAALARAELCAAVGTLAARLPGLRLAVDPAGLRVVPDRLVAGLEALPVAW